MFTQGTGIFELIILIFVDNGPTLYQNIYSKNNRVNYLPITKIYMYCKLGQACVTNWDSFILLQMRANVITNWGSFIITNWA